MEEARGGSTSRLCQCRGLPGAPTSRRTERRLPSAPGSINQPQPLCRRAPCRPSPFVVHNNWGWVRRRSGGIVQSPRGWGALNRWRPGLGAVVQAFCPGRAPRVQKGGRWECRGTLQSCRRPETAHKPHARRGGFVANGDKVALNSMKFASPESVGAPMPGLRLPSMNGCYRPTRPLCTLAAHQPLRWPGTPAEPWRALRAPNLPAPPLYGPRRARPAPPTPPMARTPPGWRPAWSRRALLLLHFAAAAAWCLLLQLLLHPRVGWMCIGECKRLPVRAVREKEQEVGDELRL